MNKPPPRIMVVVVFALVLVLRLHHAWVQRFSTDNDRDIAQLMSKHVAEGQAWPVFFYGQGYMGSLEPLCGALFCRLFGVSAFHAALGTAIPGAALAALAWLIARAIAGPWAALYAAAFFVTGSPAFSSYMGNPRGGYAFILLLSTWCLYLSARIAEREWRGTRPSWWCYLLLGLVAGAAWWTSAIVAASLAASALVVAIGLRGRILNLRIVAGLTGFVMGAAPWLLWNAQNNWQSMSMSNSLGAIQLNDSLPLLLRRLCDLAGFGQPAWPPLALGALLAVIAAACLAVPLRDACRQRSAGPLFHLTAALSFALLFSMSYVISSFARIETMRYMLPLVPVLAILAGLGLGTLTRRLPWPAHVPILVIVMGGHLAAGQIRTRPNEEHQRQQGYAREFGSLARIAGFDAIFADFAFHWINFGSAEAVPVVDPRGERYSVYARKGLLAERPAWLGNPHGLSSFLQQTASSWQTTPSPLGSLQHDLQPPSEQWRRVPPSQVASLTDQNETDIKELLLDGSLTSVWRGDSEQRLPAEWRIHLKEPVTLRGLKLYSATASYPLYLAIAGRAHADAPWVELQPSRYVSGYHWSGAMVYWQNLYHSLEARFAPATVNEVRILFPPSPKRTSYRIRIAEITLLAGGEEADQPDPRPTRDDVTVLARVLQAKACMELLANRWVSDRVAALTCTALRVRSSADLHRGINDSPRDDDPLYTICEPTRGMAFLLPPGAADETETLLRERGYILSRQETRLGTLLCLDDVRNADVVSQGPLAWFGDALFAMRTPGDEIFAAHGYFVQAEQMRTTDAAAADRLLETCLATDPMHVPALQRFLASADSGHPARPSRESTLRSLTQPQQVCSARFANGMRLEGCTVEPERVAPGETVTITYFWRAPRDVTYDDLNVFVHFRNAAVRWQDDHAAFNGVSEARIRRPPYDAPLREVRRVTIPSDAPVGAYDVAVGLVRKTKGKRIFVWGDGATWKRSVEFRNILTIAPDK